MTGIVIGFLSLLLLLYLLLLIPSVQKRIVDIAVNELTQLTGARVSVGEWYFKPFSRLVAGQVYVEDLRGDTLLYVDRLSAGFDLFGLLNDQLRIHAIELDHFFVNVRKDSLDGAFNFQFLIDAFASTDTTARPEKGTGLSVQIKEATASKGRLRYQVAGRAATDSVFDPNHIYIEDFQASLSVGAIDLKRLRVKLRSLSFRERSGFELSGLKATIASRGETITVEDVLVELPHSKIELPSASVDYTGAAIESLVDSAFFKLDLNASIDPKDLKAFSPPLKGIDERLTVEGRVEGRLPAVRVRDLRLDWGTALHLNADASMGDFLRWERSSLALQLHELRLRPSGAERLLVALTGQPLPELAHRLGELRIRASAKGALPRLNIGMEVDSRPGKIELQGEAGYTPDEGKASFDLQLLVPDYDLFALLRSPALGKAGMRLRLQGEASQGGRAVNAHARLDVERFTFNRYAYTDITVEAAYIKDSLSVEVLSKDSSALFSVKGGYSLPPSGQSNGRLRARLDRIRLDRLHLLPGSGINDLQAVIEGDITGNTLDEYAGRLSVDSLSVVAANGTFRQNRMEATLKHPDSERKEIELRSDLLNGRISGRLSLETIGASLANALHRILPGIVASPKMQREYGHSVDVQLSVENTESLSEALSLPFTVKKQGIIRASYRESSRELRLQADFPSLRIGSNTFEQTNLSLTSGKEGESLSAVLQTRQAASDTTVLLLKAVAANDSLDLTLNVDNRATQLHGSIALGAKFAKSAIKEQAFPDVWLQVHPTTVSFKNQSFEIGQAQVFVTGDRYEIRNVRIAHPNNGNISVNGVVSANENDSLLIHFGRLHLTPLAEMIQYEGVKVGAVVNGGVVLKNLLRSPFFVTNDLTIKEISVEDITIGDMDVSSAWSDKRQGILLHVNLHQANGYVSTLNGFALPFNDSLSVRLDARELELQWAQPFVRGLLGNLKGRAGVSLSARGSIRKPRLNGFMYLNETSFGVGMTNVSYFVSDSIYVTNKGLDFQRFTIRDENRNAATLSGTLYHENFETFRANLRLDTRDFLLLNNPQQKDSLFFGTLRAQAALTITGSEKGLVVEGAVRRGTSGRFFVQLPEAQAEAGRYKNLVFINTPEEDSTRRQPSAPSLPFTLPVRVSVSVELTPSVQMGAIFNPFTRDAATVSGNGNLQFTYLLPDREIKLLGDYVIEEGNCVVSLKNIARREFAIQRGSKVKFRGDPFATTFDLTAVYSLRADLSTLDQRFSDELSNTRVNTNCVLTISGDIHKMDIAYDLKLPDVDESLQRRVDNILYSDDMKIRQVAYLLALGSFFPPEGNQGRGSASIWTSLASSTLSAQLNNLLSGVLHENWTVGTHLHANDANFSDVEMDVNVSTRLFNNRLIVNTNLGYRNNTARENNLTGDFLAEYKLTRSGALRLKAYNVTNDEYFKTSLTTQGLGIVYKKEARTFKDLFRDTFDRISRIGRLPRRIRSDAKAKEEKTEVQTKEGEEASDEK